MTALERAFTEALLARMDEAEAAGVPQKRLRAEVERYGGAACARRLLARGQVSEGFDALAAAGKLELSLEALAAAGQFGELFTDAEINGCFAALCDAGFYTWGR